MQRERARDLRRHMTDAERKLWRALRDRQRLGCKFRRQHVLGPYIVDFACLAPATVVEVDGGGHAWQAGRDARRDAWLSAQGFVVLRFWNNEVMDNLPGVLAAIDQSLAARLPGERRCPHPER